MQASKTESTPVMHSVPKISKSPDKKLPSNTPVLSGNSQMAQTATPPNASAEPRKPAAPNAASASGSVTPCGENTASERKQAGSEIGKTSIKPQSTGKVDKPSNQATTTRPSQTTNQPCLPSPPSEAPLSAQAAAEGAQSKPATPSTALEIARLVTEFLGPNHPRPETSIGATLNALRTRLETQTGAFNSSPEKLSWEVREAIRTEFFKIQYPAPPTPSLLSLVTRSESLITPFVSPHRPFFFPGARVAVPTEAGSRRASTTLQLRFKLLGSVTVTEALLHLDGPNGGGFQWVQTHALTPLPSLPPRPPAIPRKRTLPQPAKVRKPRVRNRAPRAARKARAKTTAGSATTGSAGATGIAQGVGNASVERRGGGAARLGRLENAGMRVPEALLSCEGAPRAGLLGEGRHVSGASGSLRRGLDADVGLEAGVRRIGRLLGVERLIARRKIVSGEVGKVQYFVKWGGTTVKDGSWEFRDCLLVDVPGLVREFDVRHPQEATVVHVEEEKKEKDVKEEKKYNDDVSGLEIPGWLDTPILELNISGMILQIRRPNEFTLHNDAASAARDTKRRQTKFKQERPRQGEKLFALTKSEAKGMIESSVRIHRQHNRQPIPFPRGLGRVSPADHGVPFVEEDALRAPASWEGFLVDRGMRCVDFERSMGVHMPGLDEGGGAVLSRISDELAGARAVVHRERARGVLKDCFRHGGGGVPSYLLASGGGGVGGRKRKISGEGGKSVGGKCVRPNEAGAKRTRKVNVMESGWFDEVWGFWRNRT